MLVAQKTENGFDILNRDDTNTSIVVFINSFKIDLARAASHYDGKGIEEGIDFHGTMAVIRSYKNNNEHYCYVCYFEHFN